LSVFARYLADNAEPAWTAHSRRLGNQSSARAALAFYKSRTTEHSFFRFSDLNRCEIHRSAPDERRPVCPTSLRSLLRAGHGGPGSGSFAGAVGWRDPLQRLRFGGESDRWRKLNGRRLALLGRRRRQNLNTAEEAELAALQEVTAKAMVPGDQQMVERLKRHESWARTTDE
jgi:hypothetical protein